MKKLLLILIITLCSNLLTAQTSYYVDQVNGSDTNTGVSSSTAFKSFSKATNAVTAGDTILIMGEYTNSSYDNNFSYPTTGTTAEKAAAKHLWHQENTLVINNLHGSSGKYITIKPYNNDTVLKGDGGNILRIRKSSYLKIIDFEIKGEVDNIPLATANKIQFVYIDADDLTNTTDVSTKKTRDLTASTTTTTNSEGTVTTTVVNNGVGTITTTVVTTSTVNKPYNGDIKFRNEDETNDTDNVVESTDTYTDIDGDDIKRPSYVDTRGVYITNSNHVEFKNLEIHHLPGGGLRVSECAAIDMISNEIHNCSRRSYSGTHALVVTKADTLASTSSETYSIKILRNKIHHNFNEQYSWAPDKTGIEPHIDEGKGISLQRNQTSQWQTGKGRILVANNLCYWNGYSGVHSNDGDKIDFISNTCYMNSYTNTITYANETQSGKNIGISVSDGDDIKILNNISVIDTDWDGFAISAKSTNTNLTIADNLIYGIGDNVLSEDSDVTALDTNTITGDPKFHDQPADEDDEEYDFNLESDSPALGEASVQSNIANDFDDVTRDDDPDLGALEAPEAPTTISTTTSTTNCTEVALTWEDNSNSEEGFKIKKSTDGTTFTDVATAAENAESYTVTDLDGDTEYTFKVEAFKDPVSSTAITSSSVSTKKCTSTTLTTNADSYVRSGKYNENTNYGTNTELRTKLSGGDRITFIKFDLSSVDQSKVISAKLNFENTGSQTGDVKVYEVTDDTWTETGIKWTNKPDLGDAIGSAITISAQEGYEADVKSDVAAESDENITFAIKAVTVKTLFKFSSREGDTAPTLELVLSTPDTSTSTRTTLAAKNKENRSSKLGAFKVYPNPVISDVFIKIDKKNNAESYISVYNSMGRLINNYTTKENSITVPLNGNSGLYLIHVETDGVINTKKVMKK